MFADNNMQIQSNFPEPKKGHFRNSYSDLRWVFLIAICPFF